jgi:N-ethylmaleimide reductase
VSSSTQPAHPDLVDRFATGRPPALPNPATIFGNGAEGYTDYPTANPERGY